MGRYYSGDIEGKFWFGCQSSLDALNFGGIHQVRQEYKCCGCEYEEEAPYCQNCYECIFDHYQAAMEAEDVETMEDSLIVVSNYDLVSFDAVQLEEVRGHIKVLYEQIGKYINMDTVTIGEECSGYPIEFEYNEEVNAQTIPEEDDELLARYFLARQVEASLAGKGQCYFICEL